MRIVSVEGDFKVVTKWSDYGKQLSFHKALGKPMCTDIYRPTYMMETYYIIKYRKHRIVCMGYAHNIYVYIYVSHIGYQ